MSHEQGSSPADDHENYFQYICDITSGPTESILEEYIQEKGLDQEVIDQAERLTHSADATEVYQLILEAEQIAYMDGVVEPQRVVSAAEFITRETGLTWPRETIEEAQAIAAFAVEVTNVGEELKPTEYVDTQMADEALHYIEVDRANKAHKGDHNLAWNYWDLKAISEEE